MQSNIKHALRYARAGIPIILLHTVRKGVCTCSQGASCVRPGKHPLFTGGVNGATTDESKIRDAFAEHPDANIAIATGKQSGIIVIDVDPRNGGDGSLKQLEAELGVLQPLLISETGGGGTHYFFRYPTFTVRTSHGTTLGSGVDLQANGAFVVVPPSRHVSGKRYSWRGGGTPEFQSLTKLPKSWRQKIRDGQKRKEPSPPVQGKPGEQEIPKGRRNTTLTSLAGQLRNTGLQPAAIKAALLAENEARCRPALDSSEVEQIVTSITRYTAAIAPGEDKGEFIMQAVLDRRYAGGNHLIHAPDGQFWAFDDTKWAPVDQKVMGRVVLETLQTLNVPRSANTASLVKQVMALLASQVAVGDDRLRFLSPPPAVINCRNGELWIGTDGTVELKPHRAQSYLRHVLDVDYDPHATCPQYDNAITEIFCGDRAMVRHWHEVCGYVIQPIRKIPSVIVCEGGGSNGKSALLQTMVKLMGTELVSAIRVEDLGNSRFTVGSLLGKLLLLDDDVRAGIKLPDGELKKLSEEKVVTGERKFGQPFTFTVLTVPILLCNNPPSLADLSHGMMRRLMVIPFKRTFTEQEIDRDLFERISASELSGVLNRAIDGLRRIIRRSWRFKEPEAIKASKQRWLTFANPLPAFLDDRCERNGSCRMLELYQAYADWTQEMGITMRQQQLTVRRNLESFGFEIVHSNKGQKVVGLSLRG
ncbi:phage/plasmid primase, P4 family [Microvirga aerophila]|uniref:phage/plasmid primase, P4 family n=1 Tax=Microvirga aerophila TaxID=670291 RepID=UPI000DEEABE6|nr:phage/plasmid primase, P4 family [Microvirga aerophila]